MAGVAPRSAAQGESARAEQLLNDASSHLDTVFSNPGGFIQGVATFELCHAVAVAPIGLDHLGPAPALLPKAVEKGWRDLRSLESDPELAPVRRDGSIDALIERVAALPPLHFGVRLKAA